MIHNIMKSIGKYAVILTKDKRKVVIALITIIILAGFLKFKIVGTNAQQEQIQTEKVAKGTIVSSVSASGQISGANSIPVNTQATGVVNEVYVNNGDAIEAGKPIAKITLDQNGQQKQSAAWATYQSAVNSLQTAQQGKLSADAQMWSDQQALQNAQNDQNYKNANITNPTTKRDYTDLEKQSIDSAVIQAQKSFTASETKYKQADTSITAAQAQVSSTWFSYQQASNTITAPITGTVTGLTLQKGTVISSQTQSSSSNTSTTASTNASSSQKIASIDTGAIPIVNISVSEIDVPKIKTGDRATITLDALPDKTYTGSVSSIDTSGSVNSGVTTYPVIITLDTASSEIYPNMSATAGIITDSKEDVLLVPSTAVQTQNGQSTVRIKKNSQVSSVPVEIGISSDTQTEIVSGLSEGDDVVTSIATSRTTQNNASRSPFGANPFGGGIRGGGGGGGFGGNVRISR